MKGVLLILLSLWFIWFPVEIFCSSSNLSLFSMKPKVINIGALFTVNLVIERAAKPALEAAIDDVNSDPKILNGIELKLILRDTNCSGFIGTMEAELKQMIRYEMESNRACDDKQKIRFLISEGTERLKGLAEMLGMHGHC